MAWLLAQWKTTGRERSIFTWKLIALNKISLKAGLVCTLLVFFIVCTPRYNPHKSYPDFKDQYKQFGSAILAIDAVVHENTSSYPIDYDRQVLVTQEFHKEFIKRIDEEFNITIDTLFLGSSGLYLNEGSSTYVVDALNEDGEVIDSSLIIESPFYLSSNLESDFLLKEELLLTAVDTLAWDVEVEEPYFPQDVVFYFCVRWNEYKIRKTTGPGIINKFDNTWECLFLPNFLLTMFLVCFDRNNGRLIWYDERIIQSDFANGLAARRLARLFVERFSRTNPRRP